MDVHRVDSTQQLQDERKSTPRTNGPVEMPSSSIEPEKLELLEARPRHRYIFRRPRALQYTYQSQVVRSGEQETAFELRTILPTLSGSSNTELDSTAHATEERLHGTIDKQRERLDLFVDLIWVGIISNISEVFAREIFKPEGPSARNAFGLFILVFLPSWRIWNGLREFLNNYYMDDLLQRAFVFAFLAFSVFYGNNVAYLTTYTGRAKVVCISLYLFVRATLIVHEIIYAYFIPWLRKLVLVTILLYLPSISLWSVGIYVRGTAAIGPVIAAICLDYSVAVILESSLIHKLIPSDYKKALDADHFTSRMASFFIITLGEGVLQLVRDGPLGVGLNHTARLGVWSLLIYFLLAYLYFNKDSSHLFVPAVVRKGWRTVIWVGWHIPIFAGTLTLSAGIMFIIRQAAPAYASEEDAETIPEDELQSFTRRAIWTIAASLSVLVISMTVLALLDESFEPPGSLRVNNRFGRLAARIVYVLIIVLVPIKPNLGAELYLGICSLLLMLVSIYEWVASTDKHGQWFERKSATSTSTSTSREAQTP